MTTPLARAAGMIAAPIVLLAALSAAAAPAPVTTVSLAPGAIGGAVAANPLTNRVYAVDEAHSSVVLLDGTTNAITATIAAPLGSPAQADSAAYVAVNQATNQYVVAGSTSGLVFDGATNTPIVAISPPLYQPNGRPAPIGFSFPSVNETTNKMYSTNISAVLVTDLATGSHTVFATPFLKAGEICNVHALTVNPAQNWVYATVQCQLASATLFIFDGATGATLQAVDLGADIPIGANIGDVLLNPASDKLYVVNYGGSNVNTGAVIPPSTEVYNALNITHLASVQNVIGPLAVDPRIDAIYARSALDGSGAVIDGSTDTLNSTFALGFAIDAMVQPTPIAANGATHMVYYVNSGGGAVAVFQGNLPSPGSFSVSGQLSGPGAAGVTMVAQGGVQVTSVSDATGAFTLAGLPPGAYTIAPSTAGRFYSPASQSVNITTANVTGVNFVALSTAIAVTGMTLSPWTNIGPGVTTNATVTLNQAAPAGGIVLAVSSSNKVAKAPASVTVPAGSTSAAFAVQSSSVSVPTAATITATYQGPLASSPTSASAGLTVSPTDSLHILSATYSRSSQILTVSATSTNAQAILTLFLASNNQNLGTFVNQGGGHYGIQVLFTSGTPASINVKSNLGGSTGQGVTVTP